MKTAKETKGKKGTKEPVEVQVQSGVKFISPGEIVVDPNIRVRDVDRRDPKFKELVESIRVHGVLQPVILAEDKKGRKVLVAGNHRREGAVVAKVKAIPFILTKGTAEELISKGLDENECRIPMSPIQEAMVLERARRVAKAKSNVALGNILHRNPRWVADHLSLLELPAEIRDALDDNTGEVTIGKTHELMRVHPTDRAQVVPVMKRLSLNPFRTYIEKKVVAGEIRFAGGKAAPRTEKGKKGKSVGVSKAEKVIYSKKIKGEGGAEAEIDVKTPNQILKCIAECEKALNSENKKKAPDAIEVSYQKGLVHAYLNVLNLPAAESLDESLTKHDKKGK
jgi:ParB/RepB/Spo0J family partition protein